MRVVFISHRDNHAQNHFNCRPGQPWRVNGLPKPSGARSSGNNSEFNCIAGTVGGAVIGGLLGSTIGGGRGRTAMTAVGAGAGGYLGNQMGCK
ncbi:glycine zipper 2TM domain-containing protein [Neopusillimonas aromaticivorans]|uniref:glycine zipper 2TM domain-containing protein n=1 Tax=Neopusillimonas aromaticivorans TaxID=2979868 RepID=UPI002591D336|nr:glycine zipper 2TM domain-containing protein [Neopusillimonas aromaticivorans]WJJ94598.1 glycine zipper 2TM domain-containing protein [Neopusillimonas aromaticivorans]